MASTLPTQPAPQQSRRERLIAWWENRDVDINIRQWLAVAALTGLAAALLREPVLAVVAVAIALVGLGLRLWWDHALDNLTYQRRFSASRAFFGDEVTVELTAINAKPLPLTRLEVVETTSPQVHVRGRQMERNPEAHGHLLRTMFSLGMYERVTHRYTMTCHRRGWHRFGPVTLAANDPFGMVVRRSQIDRTEGVLVYPRIVPVSELVVPARQPLGDRKPATPLVEDPMRMSGVRPYVPGDSPRRIHWRATARTGELQTRVFEPSATPMAAIFLDTITFSHLWEGQDSGMLELSVMVAASLAAQMLEGRYQVGMYANAPIPNHARAVRIPPGRRPGQLTHILEQLAMLVPAFGDRIETMIARELPRLPWGASVVIVTCRATADLQRTLLRLARSGSMQRFVVIAIGEQPPLLPELRRRVTVYHLGTEEAWDAITRIQLARIA